MFGFLLFFAVGCVEVQDVREGEVRGPLGPTDAQTAMSAARIILMRDGDALQGTIVGSSMEPVLPEGTVVVLRRVQFSELESGMDVAYTSARGEQIVHQLVRRTSRGWVARGLNNPREDPDLVTADNLIGVVYSVFFNYGENRQNGAETR